MNYLNTDGGSRGNPGPAATGVVLRNSEKVIVKITGSYLGIRTNNEAEYEALIQGLTEAINLLGATEITCNLDSELVVKQLNGQYKVKNGRMLELYQRVSELQKKFKNIKYVHIPRALNSEADMQVNKILDEQEKTYHKTS